MIRLDRFLSNMGRGTRKEVRKLISQGSVTVNGAIASERGMQVNPSSDNICVCLEPVLYRPFVYLMMNKPAGVISASEDAAGAMTAADLVAPEYAHYRVSPAGRLDKDSEGFLILTNDGDYIHKVISPVKHVDKQYICRLEHEIGVDDIAAFADGIVLGDGFVCRPALLEQGSVYGEDSRTVFVTIQEGKFHQVKRMFLARNNRVVSLKRIRIGGVSLDPLLAPGESREMTEEEKERIIYE